MHDDSVYPYEASNEPLAVAKGREFADRLIKRGSSWGFVLIPCSLSHPSYSSDP